MNLQSQQILRQLRDLNWFSRCGQPVGDVSVLQVDSWPMAMESCRTRSWLEVQVEILNRVRDGPFQKDRARCNKWNDIVRELKTVFMPMVDARCDPIIRSHQLQASAKKFIGTVNWVILGWLMECEYADLIDTDWFHQLGEWYLKGHFPCGWEGEFPQGQLVVY